MNKKIIALLAVFSVSISAFAPPDLPAVKLRATTEVEPAAPVVKAPAAKEPFAPGEWVVELGANYLVAQPIGIGRVLKTDPKHGDFGVSLGVTKFVNRHFGIGIEAGINDAENIEDVDYANIMVVARTPLDDIPLLPAFDLARNIAPYAIVGGGHDFHSGKQTGFFGGGVEYRFTPRVGAFIESRFIFAEQDNGDASVTRLGVRFAL